MQVLLLIKERVVLPKEGLIEAIHRLEIRIITVLLIIVAVLPHHVAVIPAEAVVVHARHTAVEVAAVHAHLVAAVEAVAVVAVEDKHEQQKN